MSLSFDTRVGMGMCVHMIRRALREQGLIGPVKLTSGTDSVATNIARLVNAVEEAERRQYADGDETLAKRTRRFLRAGAPAKGPLARRLKSTRGGKIIARAVRKSSLTR